MSKIITVVTGLPRSGTTMMMRMLEAGGIEPYYDANTKPVQWTENGVDYINYNILLRETDKIQNLIDGKYDWLNECRGKAVKILSPHKITIPKGRAYNFIYMDRKIKHMMKSQKKWDDRTKSGTFPGHEVSEVIESHIKIARNESLEKLRRYPLSTLNLIRFEDCLKKPRAMALRVARFLNQRLDIDAMANVVEKRPAHCFDGMLEEIIYT